MASKFQTQVIRQYEEKGYRVLNIIKLSASGYPDLQCLKDGKIIFIECKEDKDTLKPLQKFRIKELREMGFEAFALHNKKGVIF